MGVASRGLGFFSCSASFAQLLIAGFHSGCRQSPFGYLMEGFETRVLGRDA